MKQEITYVREKCAPEDVLAYWTNHNIYCNALYLTQEEVKALAKIQKPTRKITAHDCEKEDCVAVDRIIDRADGKKKTVFLKFHLEVVAVECS